jgi:hypothetical protein
MVLQGEAVHLVTRLRDGVCAGACCLPRLYAGHIITVNGKVKVVIDNLANFLSISPNKTKFLPSVCLVPAFSDSVSVVSAGYQLNYCWILKLLSRPKIFKLLNFRGNHLFSTGRYTLAAYVFVPSVFGENIPSAEFVMIRQKLLAGT